MIGRHLSHAFRSLRRAPGFSLAVILTLGLGVGLNTAMFSSVYGILMRPLDLPEPDRLYTVWLDKEERGGTRTEWTGGGVFSEWRERNGSFESMAAFISTSADLTGGDLPANVPAGVVSHEYFPMLGVEPILGRGFTREDEHEPPPFLVLLSHGLWQRRFGGDPEIVGETMKVYGEDHEIVGVLPEGFEAPLMPSVEIFAPLALQPTPQDHAHSYLRVLGRLAPGTTPRSAEADMERIALALAEEYPEALGEVGVTLESLLDSIVGPRRSLLLILFGAVSLVLLAAIANVASLFVGRTAARRKELAVRLALGAGSRDLYGQLIAEALLLAAGAALVGLLVGFGGIAALERLSPAEVPRIDSIELDLPSLAYGLALAVLAALLACLLSAFRLRRRAPLASLRGAGTTTAGRDLHRSLGALVFLEVGVGIVLLLGAGLLVHTLVNLAAVDPGFETEGVVIGRVTLAPSWFPTSTERARFLAEVESRLAAKPGIRRAGVVSNMPLVDGRLESDFRVEGVALAEEARVLFRSASPGFFATVGLEARRGRLVTNGDDARSAPVALVNRRFVERFLPEIDPLGRRISVAEADSEADAEIWRTIVGVVEDVRGLGLDEDPVPEIYLPAAQVPPHAARIVARAAGPTAPALSALRETVAEVREDQVVARLTTVEERIAGSLAIRRLAAGLLVALAALLLVLVGVGVYAVTMLSVVQRRRELAVRLALGGSRRSIVGRIAGWSGLMVGGGLLCGLVAGLAAAETLSKLLYGVTATDWKTAAVTVLVVLAVGAVATLVPILRAMRLDAVQALQADA